jgi:hypothetical protein
MIYFIIVYAIYGLVVRPYLIRRTIHDKFKDKLDRKVVIENKFYYESPFPDERPEPSLLSEFLVVRGRMRVKCFFYLRSKKTNKVVGYIEVKTGILSFRIIRMVVRD